MTRHAIVVLCVVLGGSRFAAQPPKPETQPGASAAVTIVPIHHATLEIIQGAHVILVDPAGDGPPPPPGVAPKDPARAAARLIRFKGVRPPTLILVTDVHGDHLDPHAIGALRTPATKVVVPKAAAANVPGAMIVANGETLNVDGVAIEAVPMYNLQRGPQPGQLFHDKGRGNGYVVTVGGARVYVAGDTECTPEMKTLSKIDIALLPMNLPYTMTPAEAADCARAFKPKVVYPYHYMGQDPKSFEAALAGSRIEVRLRDWYAAPGA